VPHAALRRLLCLVLAAVGSAGLAAAAPAPAVAAPAELRVLSWNICGSVCWPKGAAGSQYPTVDFRGERAVRAAKVARAVRAHQATVLFTQETCATQFTAILAALGRGWYGSFKRTSDSGNCDGGSRKVGLAIFTKGRHTGYRYTLLATVGYRTWFMLCVDHDGAELCGTHVQAYVDAAVKTGQTRTMLDAGRATGRRIVAGDFNQGPTSPGVALMTGAGFREVDEVDLEPTSPGSLYKIDYIFVRGAAAVDGDSATYGPGSISDHRLLRGVIRWA
jgi:endonuclease/exonuclease/phosphatase family metal-dependent hydrolase